MLQLEINLDFCILISEGFPSIYTVIDTDIEVHLHHKVLSAVKIHGQLMSDFHCLP